MRRFFLFLIFLVFFGTSLVWSANLNALLNTYAQSPNNANAAQIVPTPPSNVNPSSVPIANAPQNPNLPPNNSTPMPAYNPAATQGANVNPNNMPLPPYGVAGNVPSWGQPNTYAPQVSNVNPYGLQGTNPNPYGAAQENIYLNGPPERNVNPYATQGGSTAPVFTEALAEASHFLNLIDQGQYGPSWRDAGPLLKDCVSEDQWIGAMVKLRRPLGNLRSRKTIGQQIQERLPYGTRGYFILVHYDSQFSGSSKAREDLILMRDDLGRFRVTAYTVRK